MCAIIEQQQQQALTATEPKSGGWAARASPLSPAQRSVLSAWRGMDAVLSRAMQHDESLRTDLAGTVLSCSATALPCAPDAFIVPLLRCIRTVLPQILLSPANQDSFSGGQHKTGSASVVRTVDDMFHAAWAALSRPSRRKAGATAALVSTCLHRCLFDPHGYPGYAALSHVKDFCMLLSECLHSPELFLPSFITGQRSTRRCMQPRDR